MPKFLFLTFLLFLQQAEANEIRIRLFKDLLTFPKIAHASIMAISPRLWSLKGHSLVLNEKKLSTQNIIVQNKNLKFDVIGQFDFDHYLAGVVASEMPERWPAEALKTQAIVARSFALARIQERQGRIFQLDSDQMDQVFRATESQRAYAAVINTKNIVLRNPDGKILKAFFHADCGGQTIPASKVWSTEIDTGTAVDPWCRDRKSNEWSFEIAQQKFMQQLKQGRESEAIANSFFEQKIQSLRVGEATFSVQKLRQIFGFSQIKNSPEKLQIQDQILRLSGKGFGHGVGLCQWGTLEQAKRGATSLEIIRHYYPKALISELETGVSLVSR